MANGDDIVQKIVVQADDQATPALSQIGQQAQASFALLQQAAQTAGMSMDYFGKLSSQVQQQYIQQAQQVASAATAAAPAIAKTGAAIKEVSDKASISKGEVRELGMVLRELGLGPIADAVRLIGGVGVHFGAFAAGAIAVAGATAVLVEFAHAAIETATGLERLHDATGIGIDSLSSMQQAFAKAGVSAKDFSKEFTDLALKVAEQGSSMAQTIEESSLKIVEAQKELIKTQAASFGEKPDQSVLDFYDRQVNSIKKVIDANKLLVAQANDLKKVITTFEDLGRGVNIAINPLTTVKTEMTAVIAILAKAGLSADDLGKAFNNNFQTISKNGQQAIVTLANIFQHLTALQAIQLGKALGLSPETIEQLRQGGQALKDAQAEAEHLGNTLNEKDVEALKNLKKAWDDFTTAVQASRDKIGAGVAPAFIQILQAARQAAAQLATLPIAENLIHSLQGIGAVLKAVFVDTWVAIGQQVLAGLQEIGRRIITGWGQIAEAAAKSFMDGFISPIVEAWNNFLQIVTNIGTKITEVFVNAFNAIMAPIQSVIDTVAGWINALLEKINEALSGLQGLFSGSGGAAPDTGGGLPMASGGLVRGRGGIDSNLAWLTQGEFVVNASAVRAIGLNALNAINAGFAPRFASGGLMGPRLAPVPSATLSGQRVLNLSIEGRSFSGLSIPEHTAQSLERFAVHSQLASTGRKPSWRR